VSSHVWFVRQGAGLFQTDEESRKVIERLSDGECQAFKRIGVRDPVMHRRYWALMTDLPKKVRKIEIDRVEGKPAFMDIFHKRHAHAAMKICTGLYDAIPIEGTQFALRVPHSTNFDEMTPDEWLLYWPEVLNVCVEKVAPVIEIPEARDDMLRYVERWGREAA
jgi:hypothetical protein